MRTPEEMKALLKPDVPDELASSIVDLIVIAVREAVGELADLRADNAQFKLLGTHHLNIIREHFKKAGYL